MISEDVGLSLDKVEPTMLGTAKKVTISKDDTIILDGGGAKGAIQERSDQIREAIDNASSDYDRCARRAEGGQCAEDGILECCGYSSVVLWSEEENLESPQTV